MHYLFDGSLAGILTCVFEAFEMKEFQARIFAESSYQPTAFDTYRSIATDEVKAQRVWKGFVSRTNRAWQKQFYYTSLSESATAFQHLFDLAVYVFQNDHQVVNNYGHTAVLGVAQMAKSVGREKHRMEAFIRFKKTADGLFYAVVEPDFNVLPIIVKHFRNRYADQPWLIYDQARRYGMYYDTQTVATVELTFNPNAVATTHFASGLKDGESNPPPADIDRSSALSNPLSTKDIASASELPAVQLLDSEEALYDQLWKDYFKSVNIVERKNMRLHLQHVPKRYWRYLNEKFD